jgi:hypothetical protein
VIAPLAAASVLWLSAAAAPARPARSCAAGSTRARIGGRSVCLSAGASCRARHQTRYRGYGFVCRRGRLEYDWASLHRPLRVPTPAPGSPCPQTAAAGTIGERGSTDLPQILAYGPGPAYPAGLGIEPQGAVLVAFRAEADEPYAGWSGTKVLWTTPRYTGAVLVRGRQLDGPNPLGFDLGPQWTDTVLPELRLVGPERGLHPAATFVHEEGCYAYQVDTLRTSYLIVFEARVRPA